LQEKKKNKEKRIRNEIFREVTIQNFLKELGEKPLEYFGHVKILDGTRILRRALELKCERIKCIQ
jgi:hypothetical protein